MEAKPPDQLLNTYTMINVIQVLHCNLHYVNICLISTGQHYRELNEKYIPPACAPMFSRLVRNGLHIKPNSILRTLVANVSKWQCKRISKSLEYPSSFIYKFKIIN